MWPTQMIIANANKRQIEAITSPAVALSSATSCSPQQLSHFSFLFFVLLTVKSIAHCTGAILQYFILPGYFTTPNNTHLCIDLLGLSTVEQNLKISSLAARMPIVQHGLLSGHQSLKQCKTKIVASLFRFLRVYGVWNWPGLFIALLLCALWRQILDAWLACIATHAIQGMSMHFSHCHSSCLLGAGILLACTTILAPHLGCAATRCSCTRKGPLQEAFTREFLLFPPTRRPHVQWT